jgi:choline kinase
MRQVVIALGGRGSRMSPLSDFIPKPLIQIQKKPFVFYIVEQFYDRGFRKFLFLLGYELTFCEKLITDYAKKNYGAELVIDFSFSSEETETGGRVINAGSKIQFPFIFLYGDIYLPLNEIQLNQYKFSNENLVGIYSGEFRKKSRNIKVENGFLSEYSSGKSENFDAVNCGYFLIQEDLYSLINSSTSVEASILSIKNKIRIQLCLNKYYTIGDPNRMSQVELFFDPRPVLLLDRDGTITLDQGPGNFLTHFEPSLVRKGVLHFFNEYSAFFRKIIIITNQPAVGNKLLGYSKMKEINQ